MGNNYAATGTFAADVVDAPLSRYDMAQIMYNALAVLGVEMPSAADREASRAKIADFNEIPAGYTDAVLSMYTMGCLQGMNDAGDFQGNTSMTRAQACTVLSRLLAVIEESKPTGTGNYVVPQNIPAPSVQEVYNTLSEDDVYSADVAGLNIVTDATDVNAAINAGKSNSYPTMGHTSEPNQNGYHTECTLDLSGCKLEYEGLIYADEYRMARHPDYANVPMRWTPCDAMEERVMVYAKVRPENQKGNPVVWVKADTIEEAFELFIYMDDHPEEFGDGYGIEIIKYYLNDTFCMASYEDETGKYYAISASKTAGAGATATAADNYSVFDS